MVTNKQGNATFGIGCACFTLVTLWFLYEFWKVMW